jgi:hypothetical protein
MCFGNYIVKRMEINKKLQMKKTIHFDSSKPYIIRKVAFYWVLLIFTSIVGYFTISKLGWSLISLLIISPLLLLCIIDFYGRKECIIIDTEGIQVNNKIILWQDIRKCGFKKRFDKRGMSTNILNIQLKNGTEKDINIQAYGYDCEEFCKAFHFYSKKFSLTPHSSIIHDALRSLIINLIIALVVISCVLIYREFIK